MVPSWAARTGGKRSNAYLSNKHSFLPRLQLACLEAHLAILDEIDLGLDTDALLSSYRTL